MDDKEYVKGTVIHQPDALPVKPVSDPAAFQRLNSLVDTDLTLIRDKAQAWDALMVELDEAVENGEVRRTTREVCERFGLESPF